MKYDTNIIRDVKDKRENALNEDISYDTFKNAFKTIPNLEEGAYYKYFQFKLLHSRLVTNEKLYTTKISEQQYIKYAK